MTGDLNGREDDHVRDNEMPYTTGYAERAGHGPISADAPRGAFTAELRERLSKLSDLLNTADTNLTELRVDKMGPWPEKVTGGTAIKAAGAFEDILMHFDALLSRADTVACHSQVLRDRI